MEHYNIEGKGLSTAKSGDEQNIVGNKNAELELSE
jgi:hypothetical protein